RWSPDPENSSVSFHADPRPSRARRLRRVVESPGGFRRRLGGRGTGGRRVGGRRRLGTVVMNITRLLRHLGTPRWQVRRKFPAASLAAIEAAIKHTEATHSGQICFAVEAALEIAPLLRGRSARERAVDVFSQLRVWDTEHNNGVLIYLLLADRDVEILADRGIHPR